MWPICKKVMVLGQDVRVLEVEQKFRQDELPAGDLTADLDSNTAVLAYSAVAMI